MPQCQFLFSVVFGSRKAVRAIFSESDEINAQVPILPGSIQNTREPPEKGDRATKPHPGAARGGVPPYGLGSPWPLRLRLFAYLSRRDLKLRHQLTKLQKDSRGAAAIAKLQFGGQNSVSAPCRDGELPPEPSPPPSSPPSSPPSLPP